MNKTHGNFFSLPNEILELDLPPSAFKVYCYFCRSANRKPHQCYPGFKTISKMLHMSVNTIQKSVGILADAGLIRTENTTVIIRSGEKRNGTLLYTVLDSRPVLEAYRQRQLYELEIETARQNYAKTAMEKTK